MGARNQRVRRAPKPRRPPNEREGRRTRRLKAATRTATYRAPAQRQTWSVPVTWVKFAVGVLLLPACLVTTMAFFDTFTVAAVDHGFWQTAEFWFFNLGFVAWMIAFWGLPRPLLLYVLGHELTHAFFILLCGGRIEKFQISRAGGYVVTDRNNVLISLSPYFVPFYTVLVIMAFGVAGLFIDFTHVYRGAIYGIADFRGLWLVFALVGITWGFHLTFTVWMIAKNQPDLQENGVFFSLVLIFLANLIVISLALVTASPEITFDHLAARWIAHASSIASWAEGVSQSVLAPLR